MSPTISSFSWHAATARKNKGDFFFSLFNLRKVFRWVKSCWESSVSYRKEKNNIQLELLNVPTSHQGHFSWWLRAFSPPTTRLPSNQRLQLGDKRELSVEKETRLNPTWQELLGSGPPSSHICPVWKEMRITVWGSCRVWRSPVDLGSFSSLCAQEGQTQRAKVRRVLPLTKGHRLISVAAVDF